MKTNIRIIYNRYNRLVDGVAPIYIEVAFNREKRKIINTKIKIEPKHWNEKKKEIRHTYPPYINTNKYIYDIVNSIKDYEVSLINSGKKLTPELLEDFLNNGSKKDNNLFYTFAITQLEKENISIESYKKNKATINKLERHTPKLKFEDLTYQYVLDIDNWLNSQSLSRNTIANYHKIIKKYINLAIKLGLMKYEDNPYLKFKVKKTPTTRLNLTEKELLKFESCKIDNPFVTRIQDMFLFSCYTGLRFSDVINLQQKNYDINGDEVTIIIKQQKTKITVELPLHHLFNGKPLQIFKKYYKQNNKYLFSDDKLTNQYVNRELKFIARTAGIFYKEITFHMARHTFGSLLAEKTGDPYLIKDLMGHSDIKMSMNYIHSSRKAKTDKLKKIDW